MSELVISLKAWAPHGPILLAREQGYLQGIPLKFHLTEDEAEKEELFIEGKIDILATTLDYVPFLAESVPDIKFFLKLGESAGADAIVALPEILTAQDLVNKTVALEPPGVSQLLLKEFLERGGLKYRDVTVKEITHDTAPNELGKNGVVAVVTWEPYVQQALNKVPQSHILLSSAETPGVIIEGLVARASVIAEHGTILVSLAKAHSQAMEYFEAQTPKAKEIMANAFSISESELQQMLDTVMLADKADNLSAFAHKEGKSSIDLTYEKLSRLWLEENLISTVVNGCVENEIVLQATG